MSRVEPQPDLPGLRAWRIQRRNRVRRAAVRAGILAVAVIASAAALPASINPLAHAGLLARPESEATQNARAADLAARLAGRVEDRKPLPQLGERPSDPLPQSGLSNADLTCLARAVFGEARGENIEAQMGVAQVVMNHAKKSGAGPCQTIAKAPRCFFPHTCLPAIKPDGMRNQWQQALWVAEEVAAGRANLRELEHAERYHSYLVGPDWKASMRRVRRSGGVIFYASLSAPEPDLTMAQAKPRAQWDEPPGMFWLDIEHTERQVEVLAHTQNLPTAPRPVTIRKAPQPTTTPAAAREAFNPFANANQH